MSYYNIKTKEVLSDITARVKSCVAFCTGEDPVGAFRYINPVKMPEVKVYQEAKETTPILKDDGKYYQAYSVETLPINIVKERLKTILSTRLKSIEDGKVSILSSLGYYIDSNKESFNNLLLSKVSLEKEIYGLKSTVFRDADNIIHNISKNDLEIIINEVSSFLLSCRRHKWDMEALVDGLSKYSLTDASINTILNTWPAYREKV